MINLQAYVVEDEANSRNFIVNLLNNYCDNISVIGEASNVQTAIKQIRVLKPDIVFLDIELNGGTGFDVLNETKDIPFVLVFVTGYDHFAIEAIKASASDYLLKPINLIKLRATIQGITLDVNERKNRNHLLLNETIDSKSGYLLLSSSNGHDILLHDDIIYLESSGNYVQFHMTNKRSKLSSYPLKHYEKTIPNDIFFRVHYSYIVNLNHVVSFEGGRTGNVKMTNGSSIAIAARRKQSFKQKIKDLAQ